MRVCMPILPFFLVSYYNIIIRKDTLDIDIDIDIDINKSGYLLLVLTYPLIAQLSLFMFTKGREGGRKDFFWGVFFFLVFGEDCVICLSLSSFLVALPL